MVQSRVKTKRAIVRSNIKYNEIIIKCKKIIKISSRYYASTKGLLQIY